MAKGTANAATNIKPTAGGGAIATLPVGGYVYGDVGATDLMNFTHWYRPSGEKMELGVPCKATLGNLTLDLNAVEPGTEPPPVEPPSEGEQTFDVTLHDTVTGKNYSGTLTEDPE